MMDHYAERLAELNKNGVELVKRWLDRTITEIRDGDRKPRVLDIGCGKSPYIIKDLLSRIEFQCCDRVDYSKHQGACFQKKTFPWKADEDVGSPFDIVLLSAVLHELCRQRFIGRIRPDVAEIDDLELPTAKWFFKSLRESGLLRPNSRVIVAELYHRDFWPYAVLTASQKWQLKEYGHADPPCAFPNPEELIAAGEDEDFHLAAFDEDFSLDEAKRNSLGSECPEAAALHLRNRRFCCLVFSYSPGTPSPLKHVSHVRPAISTASNGNKSRNLTNALKNCETSLEKWNKGEIQTHQVRDEYDRILAGLRSGSSEASEQPNFNARPSAVFPTLAIEMARTSSDSLDQLRVSRSRYHSFWLSLESRVLADGESKQKRYLPSIPGRTQGTQPDEPALQVYSPSDTKSARWAKDDWTAIAFKHLGSREAVKTAVSEFPSIGRCEPPSFFHWFSTTVGKGSEKSPNRPESLTLFFGRNSWNDIKTSDKIIEFGSNAASLIRWCRRNQKLQGKHVFVVLDAASTEVSQASLFMEAPIRSGALLNDLTKGEYCGRKGSFETHVMESIASLYLDFLFLGSFLASEDDLSGEEQMTLLERALAAYRSKWLSDLNTRFIDNQATYDVLSAKWTPDDSRAILPHTYRKRIEQACTAAAQHLGTYGAKLLPFSWSIFSTLDPMAHGREAPGNIMLFTDTVLPRAVLLQHHQRADDAFRAVHWMEEEAMEVRRVRIEQRQRDLSERASAVAGFSHQVGHVIGAKSNLPLYNFSIRKMIGQNGEEPNEELLQARDAQIRFAALLPRAFEDALDSEDAVLARWRERDTSERYILVSDLFRSVWDELARPILTYIKDLDGSEATFGCFRRSLRVKGAENLPTDFRVPNIEVVHVAFFEGIWNAFEHGSFETRPAPAVLTINSGFVLNGIRITMRNPWNCSAVPQGSTRGQGLKHAKVMIEALAAAGRRAGTSDSRHYAQYSRFESDGDRNSKEWVTQLTLGGY